MNNDIVERWHGYNEQSWQQRFEALDRRYHADQGRLVDLTSKAVTLTADLARVTAERDANAKAWNDMLALLEDAPELNPSNYDHDQVCLLNSQMIQAWQLAHSMHSGEASLGEKP